MAKKGNSAENTNGLILKELENIKNLLVLMLMKSGSTQNEIAKSLGISQTTVSMSLAHKNLKPMQVSIAK